MNNLSSPQFFRQRGAALIVGLVLMTVLTLLAVSTMRTSTLELAMAGNAQYHEQAVQLAEAGVEDAIRRIDDDIITLQALEDWSEPFAENVTIDGKNLGRYEVTVRYLNCGNPPDGSQGGAYQAQFYEIESTGLSIARNARSVVVRGLWTPKPSCPIVAEDT